MVLIVEWSYFRVVLTEEFYCTILNIEGKPYIFRMAHRSLPSQRPKILFYIYFSDKQDLSLDRIARLILHTLFR